MLAIDYSDARPDPDAIRRSGYVGVLRYVSDDPRNPKNLTRPEAAQLHARGLSIGLIFETTATRASAGHQAGHDDRWTAERAANALGYPPHCILFYAVDENVDPALILPYARGWFDAAHGLPNMHPTGVYGDDRVVEAVRRAGLAWVGWQTEAWSGTHVSPYADVYQRIHPTAPPIPGGGYDEDVLIHPVSLWAPPPPPAPPAQPADQPATSSPPPPSPPAGFWRFLRTWQWWFRHRS